MSLVGAGVVPAAPLLVAGMSQRPPAELEPVRDSVAAALRGLPSHDLLVLLAGAPDDAAGVWSWGEAELGGLSRPDLRAPVTVPDELAAGTATSLGLSVRRGPLPVDLAVLALQLAQARGGLADAVLPIAAPRRDGPELAQLGRALLTSLPDRDVVLVAAGDLSAGLTEKGPRHLIAGAADWDEAAVAALSRADAAALAALGPEEAARVVSRGWPGLVVLLGALESAGLAFERVEYAVPRGVGSVVGST